ncbi:MAG: FliA/WhiG family RNA polymerase sigma factor [Phycisphaerales bacterium]|jgi:RNA polymerase sigma factor for flagellar operon FliA|nr:FliA/WhiG family RNA polymerase sigma factor [Phycisphaerales bacterium]
MGSLRSATRSSRGAGRYAARHAEPSRLPDHLEARPIEDIWRDYRRTRSEELRNYLWEKFLPLVRYNAERIYARLPDEVDLEDLMSAGLNGLVEAINSFELERNVKFETFSAQRIRGAILDELRNMDWVPRLVRHRTSRVEQARQSLEMASGENPTDGEIASKLGLDREEFDKYKRDSHAVMTISLARKCFPSDGSRDVREIDVIRDDSQSDPQEDMQRRDLRELLTKGLTRSERLIVILYYYEGMTMKEIGATLDLSESRVSQMHSSILQRLKAQMQHRMRELEPTR